MDLSRDFREFLELLDSNGVRYLLVGGYALAAHGHPRYTKDLDVWVWPESTNAQRIIRALEEFGFGGLGLVKEDFETGEQVVQLGSEPQRIDILTFADGLSFDAAYANRVMIEVAGRRVPVLSLEDLRTNKLATGRPRDIADVADLPPT